MLEQLPLFFRLICGQNPDHTWTAGGLAMPCCERCTGLYLGVLLATTLHAWFRPPLTKPFLWLHALFILQLALFLLPRMPTGPVLRTASGLLYGFGVASFLWPALPQGNGATRSSMPRNQWRYSVGLGLALFLVPSLGAWVKPIGLTGLLSLVLAGVLVLAGLVLFNFWRGFAWLAHRNRSHPARPA